MHEKAFSTSGYWGANRETALQLRRRATVGKFRSLSCPRWCSVHPLFAMWNRPSARIYVTFTRQLWFRNDASTAITFTGLTTLSSLPSSVEYICASSKNDQTAHSDADP